MQKVATASVITAYADQNTVSGAAGYVAERKRICSHFNSLIFMRTYVCEDVWDDNRGGGGWRASEQSCLICAWGEIYPWVQCVM